MSEPTDAFDALLRGQRGLWVHSTTPRPAVGLTPHEVVHAHDKLVVRHYARTAERASAWPVVIVPSLINKAYICDLEPGRSLVAGLAALGHDVYLVDWGTPGEEDADEDVTYVLAVLLHHSILRIARHAGAADPSPPGGLRPSSKVHLFGYCMGGTLAAMYAARFPAKVGSLSTLAAPVRFRDAGRFRDLVLPLDVDVAFPAGRLVPVETMKPAFQLLDPVGSVTKYRGIDEASRDEQALRRAMVRERWLEENVPLPGAFAREFVARGYQEDCLERGTWPIAGQQVRLEQIAVPTLVVACERDFVAPLPAVAPLAELVPGARLEVLPTGHIGVVVGKAGPTTFYPLLDRFFREARP